ncbi:MAG: hypothetical protein F6K18_03290 [Okeania sp. SIO2C2]|uniref:hypothetical protein n=1 Tax=Okeania sp. SIO2C2 TaxID=2607787 RepID=UPI0013B5DDC6|nr:hypothetical protein [Okeania sp. SIO2C2]NEP85920.1 hypothetical protein [Okeania sp. SIO2C2]
MVMTIMVVMMMVVFYFGFSGIISWDKGKNLRHSSCQDRTFIISVMSKRSLKLFQRFVLKLRNI